MRAGARSYFAAARSAGVPPSGGALPPAPAAAAAAALLRAHCGALRRVAFLRAAFAGPDGPDGCFLAALLASSEPGRYLPGDWIERQRPGDHGRLLVLVAGAAEEVDEPSGRAHRSHAAGGWLCGGRARDAGGRQCSPGVRAVGGGGGLCVTLEWTAAAAAAAAARFPWFGAALDAARAARSDSPGGALWRAVRGHLGGTQLRAAAAALPRPPPPWPLSAAAAADAAAELPDVAVAAAEE